MFQGLKNLLGLGPKVDYKEIVDSGAQIIDVRTPAEFQTGHVKGSVNIPLQDLNGRLNKIKKDKPVITCCASGMRSASARRVLKSKGYSEVYNGGGWTSLNEKIR